MAFVATRYWESEGEPLHHYVEVEPSPSFLDARFDLETGRAVRRGWALALTIVLHGLFLLMLARYTLHDVGAPDTDRRNESASVFDLSGVYPNTTEPGARFEMLHDPAPAQPVEQVSPVELTTASEFVPEWTVSRIRIAVAPALSATAPASTGRGTADAGRGSGAGTGGMGQGYDPYAGASPMRQSGMGATGGGPAQRAITTAAHIDPLLWGQVEREFKRRAKGLKGRLMLEVWLDSQGRVADSRIVQAEGDSRLVQIGMGIVVGRRLGASGTAGGEWVRVAALVA